MRQLWLLRGNIGCGKSTWLEQQGLSQYALCADNIRLMLQSPVLNSKGKYVITFENDRKTWALLFEMLETRMERGELVFIDATHSKSSDFSKYKKLAELYRYRLYCLDFSDIPLAQCIAQNVSRPEYKQVVESALINIDARLKSQPLPGYVIRVTPAEFPSSAFQFKPLDLNKYENIHVIGDIHGCFEPLRNFERKDSDFYIFVGDYIDRGIQNAEVVRWLTSLYSFENVLLLEGNHERWLRYWAADELDRIRSNEFLFQTKQSLEQGALDKSEVRQLCRKLAQVAYFIYRGRTVLVTHGGISKLPENLTTVATEQFVKGVGKYEDMLDVADAWASNSPADATQLSGHRNVTDSAIEVNSKYFNLEGKIEFGGNLRVVLLRGDGSIGTREIPNTVFRPKAVKVELTLNPSSFVEDLRKNHFIHERAFGDISSFNFSRQAFYKKIWDGMTMKARGLFINTRTNEIVARSYNKFFNLGEREDQKLDNIKFQFPVAVYYKYNGFLGLIGHDTASDSLRWLSKSSVEGIYPDIFMKRFFELGIDHEALKKELKEKNISLVFEVLDHKEDPHIIEYDNDDCILLDIVRRTLDYEKLSYEEVRDFADRHKLRAKLQTIILKDQQEFVDFINNAGQQWTAMTEGYVFEDSNGLMIKIKLPYYNFWKHMRVVKDAVKSRRQVNLAAFTTPEANYFYAWLKTRTNDELSRDIITLRNMYRKEKGA